MSSCLAKLLHLLPATSSNMSRGRRAGVWGKERRLRERPWLIWASLEWGRQTEELRMGSKGSVRRERGGRGGGRAGGGGIEEGEEEEEEGEERKE